MDFEECYQLGYILKTHGLKGELAIFIDADQPEAYQQLESVFVEQNKKPVPFFIEHLQLAGQKAIVKFEEIDSIEQARQLKGAKLYLPLAFLPDLEDGYYFHELKGYQVKDSKLGSLGTITGVLDAGNQTLLAMEYRQQEVLIPLADEIVIRVDKPANTIFTTLPDGLLDLYLKDDAH